MTKHITIALSEESQARFQAEADRTSSSLEAVVSAFVEKQLDYDAWFRAEVQKGLEEADRGEFVPHEEVVARTAKLRGDLLSRKSGG